MKMTSPVAVAIFLLTASDLFRCSSARAVPLLNYTFNPDNDIYADGQVRGPVENSKHCDSTSKADGHNTRKDDSEVGGQSINTEMGKSSKMQLPMETGVNEVIPLVKNIDATDSGPLSECANLQYTVDPPTPDRENEVLEIQTKICQKLDYYPCFLGDITSFELKGEDRFDDRHFTVTVDDGTIFGLADFAAKYSFMKNDLKLLLRWKNLRLHFSLTTDEEGKDDVRSVEVHIPLLLMYVHVSSSTLQKIEMSQVNELEFKSTHYALLSNVAEWAYEDVKHRIRRFINKNLREFLLNRILEALDFDSSESMSPLCQGLEKSYDHIPKSNKFPF